MGLFGDNMETTYVMIKPDGVQRGLIGEIIGRFEQKGLKLVGLKSLFQAKRLLALIMLSTLKDHSFRD